MDIIGEIIFTLVVFMGFLTTIKISADGIINLPENKLTKFIFNPFWALPILLWCFAYMGEIARGDASYSPLIEYQNSLTMHGQFDAIISIMMSVSCNLWFFWTAGNYYAKFEKKKIGLYPQKTKELIYELCDKSEFDYEDDSQEYDIEKEEAARFLSGHDFFQHIKIKIILVRIINFMAGLIIIGANPISWIQAS